jgi:hypothetical protein
MLLPERTMFRDGRTPFCSIFTIRLLGALEEPQLRHALRHVQSRHPLLRCVVHEQHFVLQDRPSPIPLRMVERRNEDDWEREVRREWTAPFDPERGPLARVVWLRSVPVHELLLVAHHCICDGQSGITILRDLLSACDHSDQDLAPYDSLGAIEDIVPADLLHSSSFRRRVRIKSGMLRLAFFLKKFQRSQAPALPITREQIYFHRWFLEKASAAALLDRSRNEGVTVLSAVAVACMQAFRDVRGTEALRKTYTMVNARHFLPRLRPNTLFGIVPGVELRMKDLPPAHQMAIGSFWLRARALRSDMTQRIEHLGSGVYTYMVALERLHDKYSYLVAATDNAPAVRHLTISNIGKVDLPQHYRRFQLESVFSPLVMVSPTPANTLVLSSFGGRMEFAIISDESSLPAAGALAIQHRMMEILSAALSSPNNSGLTNPASAEQTQ